MSVQFFLAGLLSLRSFLFQTMQVIAQGTPHRGTPHRSCEQSLVTMHDAERNREG